MPFSAMADFGALRGASGVMCDRTAAGWNSTNEIRPNFVQDICNTRNCGRRESTSKAIKESVFCFSIIISATNYG